jgi:hypothetical protein
LQYVFDILQTPALAWLAFGLSTFAMFFSLGALLRLQTLNRCILQEQEKLEKRLRIITSGAVGMGEKIVQLESRLADVVNGHFQAAEAEAQYSYTQALKLIESGVDHTVVMSNSGLSESEVNLMELLHQARHGQKFSSVS